MAESTKGGPAYSDRDTGRAVIRSIGTAAVLLGMLAVADPPTSQLGTAAACQSTVLTNRDYQVYAAVLHENRLNGRDFRGEMLVVREECVDPRSQSWWDPAPGQLPRFDIQKRLPEADSSTVADFLRQNDSPARLEGPFEPGLNVSLLSNQDHDRFFGTGGTGWKRFYSVYPKATGVIECSRIGFSADGTQALVYIGRVSHVLAGKGHVVLLERSSGNWRVRRVEGVWMS